MAWKVPMPMYTCDPDYKQYIVLMAESHSVKPDIFHRGIRPFAEPNITAIRRIFASVLTFSRSSLSWLPAT
jgi:hypothetical protein